MHVLVQEIYNKRRLKLPELNATQVDGIEELSIRVPAVGLFWSNLFRVETSESQMEAACKLVKNERLLLVEDLYNQVDTLVQEGTLKEADIRLLSYFFAQDNFYTGPGQHSGGYMVGGSGSGSGGGEVWDGANVMSIKQRVKKLKDGMMTEMIEWKATLSNLLFITCAGLMIDEYKEAEMEVAYRIRLEYSDDRDHTKWFLDASRLFLFLFLVFLFSFFLVFSFFHSSFFIFTNQSLSSPCMYTLLFPPIIPTFLLFSSASDPFLFFTFRPHHGFLSFSHLQGVGKPPTGFGGVPIPCTHVGQANLYPKKIILKNKNTPFVEKALQKESNKSI